MLRFLLSGVLLICENGLVTKNASKFKPGCWLNDNLRVRLRSLARGCKHNFSKKANVHKYSSNGCVKKINLLVFFQWKKLSLKKCGYFGRHSKADTQ